MRQIIDSFKRLHYVHKWSIFLTIITMVFIVQFIFSDGKERVRFFTYYLPPKYKVVDETPDFSCLETVFITRQYFFDRFDGEITVFPHKDKVFYFAKDVTSRVYYTTCGYEGRDYHGGHTVYISRMKDGEVVRVFERSLVDFMIVFVASTLMFYLIYHSLLSIIQKIVGIFIPRPEYELET